MATLPGLPMFGHGQIEGYTEKYGMEYRWPRYQEEPDPWLVARHEREISPLLHQRALFAEAAIFCSTISSARTAAWTRTSLPTPTAAETIARWCCTTIATATTRGTIDFRGLCRQGQSAICASGGSRKVLVCNDPALSSPFATR